MFLWHEVTRNISTSSLDGILVHHSATPSIQFTGTHLFTWVERGTVRVKCLAQEQNTMSLCILNLDCSANELDLGVLQYSQSCNE